MKINDIPFGLTNWNAVEVTEHPGEQGIAYWRTCEFGEIRVRMVECSPGYRSDHWCSKGHIVLCLEGELYVGSPDGRVFVLKPGTTHQVADQSVLHRSWTEVGAKLFVVD